MIEVYAHRGLHHSERENTVAAFSAAVALGVDGVELDVRRTSDGTLVVHHDPLVGERVIAHSEREDLPAYVPTLAEALESLENVLVNVEIKNFRAVTEPSYDSTGDLAREVVTLLVATGWRERSRLSCFDLATCAMARSFDRDLYVGWLVWDVPLSDALIRAHVLGFNAVNPHFSLVDAVLSDEARALQLELNVWTVNREEDIATMATLGVASIITDEPELARRIVR